MESLSRLLREYEPGDLVGMADIIEAASSVLERDAPGTRAVCAEIESTFRSIARGEESRDIGAMIDGWLTRIDPQSHEVDQAAAEGAEALAFIGSAVGRLTTIVDLLKRYSRGNLALATEVLAETQSLLNDPVTPPDAVPAIKGIQESFFAYVREQEMHSPSMPQSDEETGSEETSEREQPRSQRREENQTVESDPRRVPLDDIEIVQSFIQESKDHLEDIEDRVLTLENEFSIDLVNSVFRSMHTIKGVATFVGFSYVSETSHELETLLDDIRNGGREISEEIVTILLDGTDSVRHIIGDIEKQLSDAPTPPGEVTERSFGHAAVVSRVRSIRDGNSASEQPQVNRGPARDTPNAPTAEIRKAFVGESADLLDEVEQVLLGAESEALDAAVLDRIFRAIHTIKGNAGFLGFGQIEHQSAAIEESLDEARSHGRSINGTKAAETLVRLDRLRSAIHALATSPDDSTRAIDPAIEVDALGEILVEMGEASPESVDRALATQQRRLGEILVTDENVSTESVEKALSEQTKRRGSSESPGTEYSVNRKDIRVDTGKLDKLFDLVGELITAESMVLSGMNGNGSHGSGTGVTHGGVVEKAASYLQKITREMQEITLSIRMIPLEATFGKMRRLVRDLGKRFDKKVSIQISGEQTEMDKNVIEEISDPLVHIIRNAVDHGIESPSDRGGAGKPETGLIKLSAKHEGNEIWITIEDDGRGLDRNAILEKATERGLVQPGDEPPNDDRIYRFIFEPAFSTAAQVSEISGRGVGMDVVRQNVEKLRGRIDLDSTPGEGTTCVLRIPLTLAILDGVTFAIGDTRFSVPTAELVTFQRYDESRITRTSSEHYGFRLRDTVIPIIQYGERKKVPEHGVVIVLRSDDREVALVVDRIVGYQQFVVRAMPEYVGNIRAVSGCSILGDGTISFILDVPELIEQELTRVGTG